MANNPLEHRKADYPIESIFLRRWSPRAMNGQALGSDELMTLFEAARWAASSYNELVSDRVAQAKRGGFGPAARAGSEG